MKYLAFFLGQEGQAVKFEASSDEEALIDVLLNNYHLDSSEFQKRLDAMVGRQGTVEDKIRRVWPYVKQMVKDGSIAPSKSLGGDHVDYVLNVDTGKLLVENDDNTVDFI